MVVQRNIENPQIKVCKKGFGGRSEEVLQTIVYQLFTEQLDPVPMPKGTPASSTPAFTSEDVYLKVFNLQDKVASVNRIPKPKPKIQKPAKNETDKTESSEEKAKSSDTTSEETQQSQSNESAAESNVSDNENVDTEINAHDEL